MPAVGGKVERLSLDKRQDLIVYRRERKRERVARMFQARQIKQGVIWRMVEVVGAQFFSFCSFLILTRLLAPEHFGIVALSTILILVAQLMLSQGVGEALIQREDVSESHYSSAFWMNMVVATISALVLILASNAIAAAFSEPRFGPVLRAVAPLLLLYAASGILQAKLRRDLQLKAFALATIIATISGAAVAAVMALRGYEVWSLVGQQWAFALFSTVMFAACAAWLPRFFLSMDHVRQLLSFSANTVGAAILRFSLRQVDVLVLGFHLSSKEVGLYFLGTRILATVGQLTYYSIQKIGLPVLSRLQNDQVRHHAAIISIFRLTCLVCLPIYFGLALTADLLIPLVFGDEWAGSIAPFRLLCLFSIFYALSLIANQVMLSADDSATVLRLSVLNALVFAGAVALAAPYGITTTALAGGLANMVLLPAYFLMLRRRLGLNLTQLGHDIIPLWTAGLLMVGGLLIARHTILDGLPALPTLILAILLGVVIFTSALLLLCRDYAEEMIAMLLRRRSSS